MTSTYITDEMRAAIGREYSRSVSYPVSASDIRRWAIAVYYPEPPPACYWDEEVAAKGPFGGIIAPQDFNAFAWMSAEPKGRLTGFRPNAASFESQIDLPEVPTKFMLNGGLAIDYGVPIRPGDVITSTSSLANYEEREGRLGLMLLTSTTNRWENQNGEHVKSSTNTLIRY